LIFSDDDADAQAPPNIDGKPQSPRSRTPNPPYTAALILCLATDVVFGISYMHVKDIIHGDIKSANILLDHNGSRLFAVLTDFGYSAIMSDKTSVSTGFQKSNIGG